MPITVPLPNYTTVHINERGEVFYLTPLGGHTIQHYDSRLSDYQKADLNIRIGMSYNAEGYLIHPDTREIIQHSIAKKREELTSESHKISLWIGACHFIVIKSSLGRYWFLHYDPGQARAQSNNIDGLSYPRPNYSDLRPVLPYSVEGVTLQENETIQVVVVEPDKDYDISNANNLENGEFDAQAFKDFVGADKVKGIEVIRYKDHLTSKRNEIVDLSFFTQEDRLDISFRSMSPPFYSTKNLFPVHSLQSVLASILAANSNNRTQALPGIERELAHYKEENNKAAWKSLKQDMLREIEQAKTLDDKKALLRDYKDLLNKPYGGDTHGWKCRWFRGNESESLIRAEELVRDSASLLTAFRASFSGGK